MDTHDQNFAAQPHFVRGPILHTRYDGDTDDLLTAGLGRTGLSRLSAQDLVRFADPLRPTPAELRRNAILNSHFSLIDRTEGGGYGRLYGPGVVNGKAIGEGKIAGDEYLTCAAAASGRPDDVVTMLVQVPASFRADNAWIIAAPSSGSRGVYGAVATVGEWALQREFAVVYTDKGTGVGAHDLDRNVATLINGEWADTDALGAAGHFRVRLTPNERGAFVRDWPHQFAFKHAHSEINPE